MTGFNSALGLFNLINYPFEKRGNNFAKKKGLRITKMKTKAKVVVIPTVFLQ